MVQPAHDPFFRPTVDDHGQPKSPDQVAADDLKRSLEAVGQMMRIATGTEVKRVTTPPKPPMSEEARTAVATILGAGIAILTGLSALRGDFNYAVMGAGWGLALALAARNAAK